MDTFKTIVVAIVAVLGMVGTASAEGAWVPWGIGGDVERTYSKSANAAFDTRDHGLASVRNRWLPVIYIDPEHERLKPLGLCCGFRPEPTGTVSSATSTSVQSAGRTR